MERNNLNQHPITDDIFAEKTLPDARSPELPENLDPSNQTDNIQDLLPEKTVPLVRPDEQAAIDSTQDENTILRVHTPDSLAPDPDARTLPLQDPQAQTLPLQALRPVAADFNGGPRVIHRYRGRDFPLYLSILLVTMACLLIFAALGLVFYASSVQYKGALNSQATAYARATASSQAVANAQEQATLNALGTVQAQIVATATSQAGVQASATAAQDQATAVASQKTDQFTKASTGTPALNDPLGDSTGTGKWDTGTASPGTGCHFISSSYNVTVGDHGFLQPCLARATNYKNFAYQVQMSIVDGSQGGILFDANADTNTYYFFRVGIDGSYALDLYQGNNQAQTLSSGITTAITPGLNASNTLAVLSQNGEIDLFVNQQFIASVTDTQLSSGEVGVAAIDYNTPTQINFTNAQAWGK